MSVTGPRTQPQPDPSVERLCRDGRLKRVIAECAWPESEPESLPAVATGIHPGCQMLHHSLTNHLDASAAVSQYFAVALQQFHVVERIRRLTSAKPDKDLAFLDFACGYGRLVRFLIHSLPAARIWASDIQPPACEYVSEVFGVNSLASAARPEDFHPARRFDFIWVASLFSHLPPPLFSGWLGRLASLLSPGGILSFSVRDETLLPSGQDLPESGIGYFEESENPDLDASRYGTTFVNQRFVDQVIATAAGSTHSRVRLPRALAFEQDIYVVARAAGRQLSGLDDFRRGPWGWVDIRRIEAGGRLKLAGWAASPDDGLPATVEILVDGTVRQLVPETGRPDVVAALSDPRLLNCGWSFEADLAGKRDEAFVQVTAESNPGERALLFAGSVHK